MNSDQRFPPICRLRQSREFKRIRQAGRKTTTPHFFLYLEKRPQGVSRLGITASRKVGGAVQRNRIKRLLREYFRRNRHLLVEASDVSIVVKTGAADLTYCRVVEELSPIFRKDGQGVT